MKKYLFFLLLSFGRAEECPFTMIQTNMEIPNGCYIKSIAFEDALKTYDGKASSEAAATLTLNSDRWVKVLIVGFLKDGAPRYHAICVFEYNDGVWVYDPNYGTYRLTHEEDMTRDPLTLASKWKPALQIISANFVDPIVKNVAASSVP